MGFYADLSNNGSCKNCFRAIEKVIKLESDLRDLQQQISQARRVVRRKYQLATPSPTKAKIEKRLLKSPQVSDEKPQKKFPTTVNVITVVTIPSFEELSRSKSVHEPAHVDIQCTIKYRVKCKEGKGCEKSFAIY